MARAISRLTAARGFRPGRRLSCSGRAAASGVSAVEIGARMGARVIACARGAAKLEAARAAGAHVLVDTDTTDLREALRAEGGADVVFDTVGGAASRAALRAMKPEGRVLLIGFASGELPEIAANHLLVKNVSVIGFYWGGYLRFRPEALTDSLATLMDWYAEGACGRTRALSCRSTARRKGWSFCAAGRRPARS
jgi:NADPH:quinone reductase